LKTVCRNDWVPLTALGRRGLRRDGQGLREMGIGGTQLGRKLKGVISIRGEEKRETGAEISESLSSSWSCAQFEGKNRGLAFCWLKGGPAAKIKNSGDDAGRDAERTLGNREGRFA